MRWTTCTRNDAQRAGHVHLLLLPHDRVRRAQSRRRRVETGDWAAGISPTSPTCGARSRRRASGFRSIPSSRPTRNGGRCAAGTARTNTTPTTNWWRRCSAATAPARHGVDDRLENGVYSFQYHPELARDPSVNDGRGTLDYVRYCINLAERKHYWIATQARALPAHGRLRGPGVRRPRRRPRGHDLEPDRPAHHRDGDRAAPAVRQRLARRGGTDPCGARRLRHHPAARAGCCDHAAVQGRGGTRSCCCGIRATRAW